MICVDAATLELCFTVKLSSCCCFPPSLALKHPRLLSALLTDKLDFHAGFESQMTAPVTEQAASHAIMKLCLIHLVDMSYTLPFLSGYFVQRCKLNKQENLHFFCLQEMVENESAHKKIIDIPCLVFSSSF